MEGRSEAVKKVISLIESDMEFLGITGVEDKLQDNIAQSLENMRNAGIKIWMLTGDKIETAICISISSGLKSQ
jgi:phospholipid-translocating ATPase